MTAIVVVQFVSDIQTSMDIKYNLTCVTRGPGSAVVTSGLIGAGYCSTALYTVQYSTAIHFSLFTIVHFISTVSIYQHWSQIIRGSTFQTEILVNVFIHL